MGMLKHSEAFSGRGSETVPGAVSTVRPVRTGNMTAGMETESGSTRFAGKTVEPGQRKNAVDNQYTWEQWFEIYKLEAGRVNPMLAVNAQGNSVLDFMDKTPLRDAHSKNICPRTFGRLSARQLDI